MLENRKSLMSLVLLVSSVGIASAQVSAGEATAVSVGATYVAFQPQDSGAHVMVVSCEDGAYIEESSTDGEAVTISLANLSLMNGRCKYEMRGEKQQQAGSFQLVDGVATAHHVPNRNR